MTNQVGRPAVMDIGGRVNETTRINVRASDTLRLCVDVMARRKKLSATEYVRKILEADAIEAMLRTTGNFLGSVNGLKQIVHDVRKKGGLE